MERHEVSFTSFCFIVPSCDETHVGESQGGLWADGEFQRQVGKHAGLAAGHFQVVDLLSYEESDVLSIWVATLGI